MKSRPVAAMNGTNFRIRVPSERLILDRVEFEDADPRHIHDLRYKRVLAPFPLALELRVRAIPQRSIGPPVPDCQSIRKLGRPT